MLFTESLEKRRNGTSGRAIVEAGKAVAERKSGDGDREPGTAMWQRPILRSGSDPLQLTAAWLLVQIANCGNLY